MQEDVLAGGVLGQHEAQRVGPVAVHELEGIDDVAQRLRHLAALGVPDDPVHVHPAEGHVAHEVEAGHDHAGHPQVDDLVARDEHRGRIEVGEVGGLLRCIGHRADRSQHRPLDGLLHGAVGGVARRAKRLGEVVALRERFGRAADDLREDDARVAARAHQRSARDLVREPGAIVGAVLVQR